MSSEEEYEHPLEVMRKQFLMATGDPEARQKIIDSDVSCITGMEPDREHLDTIRPNSDYHDKSIADLDFTKSENWDWPE